MDRDLTQAKICKKVSEKELNLILQKGLKTKKAGGIVITTVPVAGLAGIILTCHSLRGGTEAEEQAGTVTSATSAGLLAAGLIKHAVGCSRVKRVKETMKIVNKPLSVKLDPRTGHTVQSTGLQKGLSLKIRF